MSEGYPDNNPKTQHGMKKCPMDLVPPALIRGAARAFANGAGKYGAFNWREKKISSTVYYAAFLRHVTDWYDRVDAGDLAPDSGVHHLEHAVACIGMILDTMGSDLLNDNRPQRVDRTTQAVLRCFKCAAPAVGHLGTIGQWVCEFHKEAMKDGTNPRRESEGQGKVYPAVSPGVLAHAGPERDGFAQSGLPCVYPYGNHSRYGGETGGTVRGDRDQGKREAPDAKANDDRGGYSGGWR